MNLSMMKPRIRIVDTQFGHAPSFGCGGLGIHPTYFDWYRGNDRIGDVVVVTENCFDQIDNLSEEKNIGLILEPQEAAHSFAMNNLDKFYLIFTHDISLLSVDPKFKYYPFGGCWIHPKDWQLYPKTKNISIIVSVKNEAPGHKLRHEIVRMFGDQMDVFGIGYRELEYKLDGLRDYRYSVVVEGVDRAGFFTEKLIDCFTTGTIPIYWGGFVTDAGLFKSGIDESTMLRFQNIEELKTLLRFATFDYYELQRDDLETNFKVGCVLARPPEDWLWENHFKYLVPAT